mgnify:CR=1 FL=1
MPEVHIYPGPMLPPSIKCQILSFIRIKWWWIFQGEHRFWDYTEKATHPVNVVLIEQELVVSHAEINRRMIEHTGQTFNAYGLSAVFTYPAWRKAGYGRQVVEAATHYIEETDADVAMLFCLPNLVGFYQRCGWEHVEKSVLYGDPHQPTVDEEETLMMRFVSERGKLARSSFLDQAVYVGQRKW